MRRLLGALCALVGLPLVCLAQPFEIGWGYGDAMPGLDAGGGPVAMGGNSMFWATFGGGLIHVLKFNNTGDRLWSHTITTPSHAVPKFLALDGNLDVYLAYKYSNPDFSTKVALLKMNSLGAPLWTKTISVASFGDAAVALSVDPDGTAYWAVDVHQPTSGAGQLLLQKYTGAGVVVYSKLQADMDPTDNNYDYRDNIGAYCSGKLYVARSDRQVAGSRFSIYDAATGNVLHTETSPDTTQSTTQFHTNYLVHPVAGGVYYLGIDTTATQGSTSHTSFHLEKRDANNAVIWKTTQRANAFVDIIRGGDSAPKGGGPGATVPMIGGYDDAYAVFYEILNGTNGVVLFLGMDHVYSILPRVFGYYYVDFDSTGVLSLEAYSMQPPPGPKVEWSDDIRADDLFDMAADTLVSVTQYHGTAHTTAALYHPVSSLAPSGVTMPASAKGGASFTLTVSVDGLAPAGGYKLNLTGTPGVLYFPNNASTYVLTVPAGKRSQTVLVHSPKTTKTEMATVTARGAEARRSAIISITP